MTKNCWLQALEIARNKNRSKSAAQASVWRYEEVQKSSNVRIDHNLNGFETLLISKASEEFVEYL